MKNILVLCDDIWHPSEVIEKGLEPLQDKVYHFDFIKDAKDILTPEMLCEYDLVMNCKCNNITNGNSAEWFEDGVTEVGPAEFTEFVKNGGRLLSVHAGNTYHENNAPKYAELIGNSFVGHPPRCTVNVKTVGDHTILDGVSEFVIRDEHYNIVLTAKDAEVFLESESESGGKQVAGYTRKYGKGRICVLTPGHILSVWRNPQFQRLLINSIEWCTEED